MKKLLFFDIDGTILTQGTDRYVPDSVKTSVQALQERGHLCFINTGRTMSEIQENISGIGFDGFVCGCGTYISFHGDILFSRHLPLSLADSVIEDLNRCKLEWVLEGSDKLYYSTLPYTTRIGDFRRDYTGDFAHAACDISPSARGLCYDKFCLCITKDSDFQTFYHKYQKTFTFIDRGRQFYEVVPSGYSKASGIQFLMEHFKIPREDTIALGDSTNDLPMLEFAGYSIAMKDSAQEVLEVADYVTDTVEQDGVQKALQDLDLI